MLSSSIEFLLNNELITINEANTNTTVLEYLRNYKNLKGTKEGCASGDCGACTAVIAEMKNNKLKYKSINTCITLLYSLHSKQLLTVEYIESKYLHPVQQSMVDNDGAQCGFCTPGFIMSMYAMHKNKIRPTDSNINRYLSGNLCRCTGYRPIKESLKNLKKYKNLDSDTSKVFKKLKKIKLKDVVLNNDGSKFYIHQNLKSFKKDFLKSKNPSLLVGGTDISLDITKKRRILNEIFYLGQNKDLNYVRVRNNNIHIGAATPINDILGTLKKYYPAFYEMFERYGSEQIRNVASLGGNIGSASPIGDSLPVLISLDATLVLDGLKSRKIEMSNYFVGYRQTKLRKNEFIKEIIIPLKSKNNIHKCYKISKRIDDDISSVFMAINTAIKNNTIKSIKIVCGGMAATPKIAKATEKYLKNKKITYENISKAKLIISKEFSPLSDVRGSKNYRTKIVSNLLDRFWNEYNNKKVTVYDF